MMKLPHLVPGRFLRRVNRFAATVTVGEKPALAHIANSGRLQELFTPGRSVWLAPAAAPQRKTAYDLKLVAFDSVLVSVDARLPNPLVEEALRVNRLPGFRYPEIRREVAYGASRLDFRLARNNGVCWVETKSVTLVERGVALFPDAPTDRGRKHLQELAGARQAGDRAAVIFVVQRPDALSFAPHPTADPAFPEALRLAAEGGVMVRAFVCQVSLEEISISREIPVEIP